jgi:outer membrane receptor protein involved in Fe transport
MKNFKRWFFVCLALLVAAAFAAPQLLAQTTTTGDISGIVSDPTGAVVPDAKITLKDVGRGASQDTATNKDGAYRFYLLPPGAYKVSVAVTGFQAVTQTVEVAVGQVATVNLQLALGAASQTVVVTEQAPLIQVDSGNVAATISETQAANVPNPGNDITYIAQLAPGTVGNTAGGGLGNFSSFGMSALSNLFTVNGMDDNDPFLNLNNSGATNLTLGQNEIQEVSVVTNGYSGEYGGLAGANINYITRGGTNQFHGRASYYWNGRTMNANTWFNNSDGTPRSFVNANQYGGDIGGPIVKDKVFFYFNAEGLYLIIPTSNQVVVPSPAFEAATLANINTKFGATSTISQFYQNMFNLYNNAPGINRAQNTIGNGDCDGSLAQIGLTFGTANPCGLAFQSNISNTTHENLQSWRIDYNATSRDRLFGRVQHDFGLQASFTDPINPVFNVQSAQPEWQGQLQETHSFSGGAVNQFVISGQYYAAVFSNPDRAAALAAFPTTIGWSFSSGQFSNLGGIDYNFPQGRRVSQFQFSDDWSKTYGAHTIKVGAKYRRNDVTDVDFGVLTSGLTIPVTQLAFFEGGQGPAPPPPPPQMAAPPPNLTELLQQFPTFSEAPFAVYSVGGYVEDDWRLKPNFTLTLAFRLDHSSNTVCTTLCFVQSATQFPQLNADPNTPYNQLVVPNEKQQLPDLTTVEPQPRVGFAWQPNRWGLHNTVIRGGAGIFYDAFPGVLIDNFANNPPNNPEFIVASSNISAASDPSSLFAAAATSNAAFQAGFHNGESFNQISASVPGFTAPNLASVQNHPKVPQYVKWNLSVERQFGTNTSVSVQYVGNHGSKIFFLNNGINGFDGTGTFASLPAAAPNPSFNTVLFAQNIGESNYSGVTASFTHRYKSGLVQINYSYSHALDDVSNSGVVNAPFSTPFFGSTDASVVDPEDPQHPKKFNYGSSDQDIRHLLNANYVWELPIRHYITRGHGPAALVDGWDVNGATFLRSGFPFSLLDGGTSAALANTGYGSTVLGTVVTPGGAGVNCVAAFPGTPQPNHSSCLNPADFTTSGSGFGNVTRNTYRGPYYWDTDFSLIKHVKITEKAEVALGAQFFNVFNHPNFDAPVLDASSPRFGQIIRTVSGPTTIFGSVLGADASPRLIQLKAQFSF